MCLIVLWDDVMMAFCLAIQLHSHWPLATYLMGYDCIPISDFAYTTSTAVLELQLSSRVRPLGLTYHRIIILIFINWQCYFCGRVSCFPTPLAFSPSGFSSILSQWRRIDHALLHMVKCLCSSHIHDTREVISCCESGHIMCSTIPLSANSALCDMVEEVVK